MRERQEIRISLDECCGSGSYGPISVVYCSRERKDNRAILNRIIEDIKNRLSATHIPSYQNSSIRYVEKWIAFLENAGPDYMKWQRYNLPSGEFYMHHLVIPRPTIDGYGTRQIIEIGRLLNDLFNSAKYPFTPSGILRDEIYSVAEIKFFLNGEIFCSSGCGDIVEEYLRNLDVNDFLAFSYELDTTKIYNNGSVIKANLITYESLSKCVENINSRTANIGVYALSYDTIGFGNFKPCDHNMGGAYVFKKGPHFKVEGYRNILILYDGNKGRNDMEPLLHMNNRPMTILSNQYETQFMSYSGQRAGDNASVIYLFFIDPKNIVTRKQDIIGRNGYLHCSVQYRVSSSPRFNMVDLGYYNNSNRYKHSYIIPFGEKSKETIEIVKKFIEGEGGSALCDQYLNMIYPQEAVTPDNLSEWFTRCAELTKKNHDGVVMAYKRMKEQLEKEYKEIGAYLDYYNFANCASVPSLKIDKNMLKRYSKTLRIEPHCYKINIVNNKSINEPINQIRASINMACVTKNGRVFAEDVLLDTFYDSKNNTIDIGTKKMKGVIYDKIKNR